MRAESIENSSLAWRWELEGCHTEPVVGSLPAFPIVSTEN